MGITLFWDSGQRISKGGSRGEREEATEGEDESTREDVEDGGVGTGGVGEEGGVWSARHSRDLKGFKGKSSFFGRGFD